MRPEPKLPRTWSAALPIVCLLLGQSRALAARWEARFDPRLPTALAAGGFADETSPLIVVPWPDSLRLLGVTEGRWDGDPFPGPDVCGDSIHIPDAKGLFLAGMGHDLPAAFHDPVVDAIHDLASNHPIR